jgi:hypothetical protein
MEIQSGMGRPQLSINSSSLDNTKQAGEQAVAEGRAKIEMREQAEVNERRDLSELQENKVQDRAQMESDARQRVYNGQTLDVIG